MRGKNKPSASPDLAGVNTSLTFAAPYNCEHAGICLTQSFFADPELRVSKGIKLHFHLLNKKNSLLGMPSVTPAANHQQIPAVWGYETTTIPMMLGCRVSYQDSEFPHAKPLNLDDEAVMALEPIIDFSDNPVMQDLEDQAHWIKEKYGRSAIQINMQSPLNIAFKLRGDQLHYDFFDHPELVHKLMNYCQETWINIRRWIENVNVSNGTPPPSGRVSIDNCTAALISPDIYREFVFPYDLKTSEIYKERLGVHHCGANMEKFAEHYAALGDGCWYDIGYGSCVEECVNTFNVDGVSQQFSVRYGPARLLSAKADDITRELDEMRANGGSYIRCIGTDPETPDENLKAFWGWVPKR